MAAQQQEHLEKQYAEAAGMGMDTQGKQTMSEQQDADVAGRAWFSLEHFPTCMCP